MTATEFLAGSDTSTPSAAEFLNADAPAQAQSAAEFLASQETPKVVLDPYQQTQLSTGTADPSKQSFEQYQAQHPTETDLTVQALQPLADTPEKQAMLGRFVAARKAPELETPGTMGQMWQAAWSAPTPVSEYVQTERDIRQSERDTDARLRQMAQQHGLDPDKVAKLPGVTEQVAQGGADAMVDLAQIFLSPAGALTLGIGALPKTAQKMISLAFAGQMLSQTPDQAQQLLEEIRKPDGERDYRKIAQLAVNAGASVGLGALAGKHGAGEFLESRLSPGSFMAKKLAAQLDATPVADQTPAANVKPIPTSAADFLRTPDDVVQAAVHPDTLSPVAAPDLPTPQPTVPPAEPATADATEQTAPPSVPAAAEIPLVPVDISEAQVKAMRMPEERPPDVLDTIADHFPEGVKFESKADFGEYVNNAQGRAKELMSHGQGEPVDKVLDGLHLSGMFQNIETPDELAQAMVDAGRTRVAQRSQVSAQARQLAEEQARTQLWEREALDPKEKTNRAPLPAQQLFTGDTFQVNGQPMKVTGFAMDAETGQPFGVELEGAYGKQTVPANAALHIDKGSLQSDYGTEGRVAASGTSAPRQRDLEDKLQQQLVDLDEKDAALFKRVMAETDRQKEYELQDRRVNEVFKPREQIRNELARLKTPNYDAIKGVVTQGIGEKGLAMLGDDIHDFVIYRGESEPPHITSVKEVTSESSRISNSRYPVVELKLSNGSKKWIQIRISDHGQVSRNSPYYYSHDVRFSGRINSKGNEYTKTLQKAIAEETQPTIDQEWADQRQIIENANASPKAGVAGIKTSLETESQADKGGIATLQPEGTSALTGAIQSQPAEPVKPGRVAAAGTAAPRQNLGQRMAAARSGGGSSRPNVSTPVRVPAAVAATPAPRSGPLAALRTGFLKVFAPHRLDAGALDVANIQREVNGERANKLARADEAMHEWRQEFNRTPVPNNWQYDPAQPLPHNYAVIDAMERDRATLPPRYQQLAQFFDQAFKDRIDVIQKFAPNALQKLIENYFPHVWKDPQRAQGVMSQVATKLFAGRKEFLKQRSLPMFRDGLERGLQPVSDNPVDLLLAKMESMDKFIAAQKAMSEFKAIGELKFKYALEKMPDGWEDFNDPSFIVQAPPEVTIKEAYDAQLRTRTVELLQKLGVPEKRLATLGGKRWGVAYERPEQIKTRFGGPMSVYWHELGHILDFRYDLQKTFLKQDKTFDQELRYLADRRLPTQGAPKSMRAYVRSGVEKMAVMTEAYVHAPEVFQRVAPTVYAKFDRFIEDHPELHDIRDIKPSLRLGTEEIQHKLPGTLKLGSWIMREGPAQVIKNYLSPGLSNSGVYRSIRAASNILNAAQLGLSGFHVGFTSLDAAISTASVGLVRASRGDLKGAGRSLATAPLAPVLNYYTGKAVQRAMLDPNARSIRALNFGVGKYRLPGIEMPISQAAHDYAKLAVKAGLRATVDPFWQTHFTRNLMRSVHQGGLMWAKTPLQLPFALIEQSMRPIAEYLVPRQKLGVFAQIARAEMDRIGPGASVAEVRNAVARAADYTEDRMGQMTYDNLFYNRIAKDLAMLAFRAYGWQLGKYRHLIGAVADTVTGIKQLTQGKAPELTHRQGYFVMLTVTVAAVGAILHRLFTGKAPETALDYFHPATGQLDANGNPKRLSLPSYMKDLESDWAGLHNGYKSGGVVGMGQGVWTSTYHRLNPMVSMMVDMINNKDFYGTQIWDPNDSHLQQLGEQAKFIGKNAMPFSIANSLKLNEGQASFRDKALPFIGVVPASKLLTMTPLEAYYSEQFRATIPAGPVTQAQSEKFQARAQLVSDLKSARASGTTIPDLRARLLAAGVKETDTAQLNRLAEKAEALPIQYQAHYLPLEVAMRGFDLANENEKGALANVLIDRVQTAWQKDKLSDDDTRRYMKVLMAYYKPSK